MKKIILLSLFVLGTFGTTFAQRIAYVDTEYILSKMTEYKDAQKELEAYTVELYNEVAVQEQKLIQLQAEFEKNKLLMPENVKLNEEENIKVSRNSLETLKNKSFGANGRLIQHQQNLIRPIQDKIYNAVKQLAERRGFDYILDKSTGVSILYVKPEFDMSEEVLKLVNASSK